MNMIKKLISNYLMNDNDKNNNTKKNRFRFIGSAESVEKIT